MKNYKQHRISAYIDLVNLFGYDKFGRLEQPVSIGLGGLEQSVGYDLAGRVIRRKVVVPGLPNIQNEAYEYDSATGNMLMRCESVFSQEESFAYDYLNRLANAGDHSMFPDFVIVSPKNLRQRV